MNREQKLRFEILISDLLESLDIKTGEQLTKIMVQFHEYLENGAYDYAIDNNIYDDYESSY